MDVFDQAQERDAKNLAQALQVQQQIAASTPRIVARGYCYNPLCENEFDESDTARLFCGPACAEQHQRYTTNR